MWKDADKPDQSQTLLIDIPNVLYSDITEQEKQIAKLKEEHELALKTERDQAAMREAQLEKKVKSSNSEEAVIALKIIFADTQKSVNAFLDKINDLQSDDDKIKFKSGAREWLSLIVEKLGEEE